MQSICLLHLTGQDAKWSCPSFILRTQEFRGVICKLWWRPISVARRWSRLHCKQKMLKYTFTESNSAGKILSWLQRKHLNEDIPGIPLYLWVVWLLALLRYRWNWPAGLTPLCSLWRHCGFYSGSWTIVPKNNIICSAFQLSTLISALELGDLLPTVES